MTTTFWLTAYPFSIASGRKLPFPKDRKHGKRLIMLLALQFEYRLPGPWIGKRSVSLTYLFILHSVYKVNNDKNQLTVNLPNE